MASIEALGVFDRITDFSTDTENRRNSKNPLENGLFRPRHGPRRGSRRFRFGVPVLSDGF